MRDDSPTGGPSSPYAPRSIRAASCRTAATGSSASRRSASAGSGEPRSFSDSSTTRSGVWIARPRNRPSTKSTARRSTPENGERRNVKRSRRVPGLAVARGELFDPRPRQAREVLGGPPKRRERGPPGLVRQRDAHLGAGGERLEERPLGAGQILEAVREDGLRLPGVEVGLE